MIHLKQINVGVGMTVFVDVWALFLAVMVRRWRWWCKNEWLCYLRDFMFFFEFCYYCFIGLVYFYVCYFELFSWLVFWT